MTMPTSEEQPTINIWGRRVALGPLRREYLPLYHKWLNDFEVLRTLNEGIRPRSIEALQQWYDAASTNPNDVFFTIYERATLRPIGVTDLIRISQVDQRCEFAIHIGDKQFWSQGYGTEAVKLVLDYGFNALNLDTILLRVFSYNQRAIHAYENAGFKHAGRWRHGHRAGGEPFDVIFMDCLATEFQSSGLHQLLLDPNSTWDSVLTPPEK